MTKEELKQQFYKYIKDHEDYFDPREPWTERIILQIWLDCAEPREKQIAELEQKLEQTEKDLADYQFNYPTIKELEKENAELRKVAEFQQSSNMNTHFENKKLKEGLAVGSTWNKHLNSLNKALEEERDKYRNMVFDLKEENAELKESYCLRRCKHCEFLHENGNCLKVGGYFTAVDNKDCPILKDKVELIKENQKWKDEWQEQVQKATDEGYARTLQTIQLTKAVEIIKTLADDLSMYSGNYQKELLEAEQFLKEVEK